MAMKFLLTNGGDNVRNNNPKSSKDKRRKI